jgi:hypothetical protein
MSLHVRSLSLEMVHLWFVLVLIVSFDCLVQVLACPQITEGANSHQRQEPSQKRCLPQLLVGCPLGERHFTLLGVIGSFSFPGCVALGSHLCLYFFILFLLHFCF